MHRSSHLHHGHPVCRWLFRSRLPTTWLVMATFFGVPPGVASSSDGGGAERAGEQGAEAASPVPLRQRVDAIVESWAVGPLAAVCDDADFVRRVYLDLVGIIPTAEETREFLSDPSPDKRAVLVDALLERPEFDRHMATQLDVLLLERRTDSHVDVGVWETYLIDAIARRKPIDELLRELLYPDELDGIGAAASKFLLNREAEPHAMTRDVGRLFFGMDLQCAQCHDHPLIDDYHQEDYYGLHAFLDRTKLFVEPKSKKGQLSEQAEGETPFESVFTGIGRERMLPRVPLGESVVNEPSFPEEEAYLVVADKTQAAKPRHSRRELLAELLPENERFRRNLTNRVWGLLFGRGLVHPADFHSLDNPPVNPELLAELTEDWASHGWRLRYLIRELALTRAYQRSCDPPPPSSVNFADIEARRLSLEAEREERSATIPEHVSRVGSAESEWHESMETHLEVIEAVPKVEARLAEAREAVASAGAERKQAGVTLKQLRQRAAGFDELTRQSTAIRDRLPEEPILDEVATKLAGRWKEIQTEVAAAEKAVGLQDAAVADAKEAVGSIESELEALESRRVTPKRLRQLERTYRSSEQRLADVRAAVRRLGDDLKLCEDLLAYRDAVGESPERAEAIWDSVVERWTSNGQVAPLKPLTPEQLAMSMMRATGALARYQAAAEAAVEKDPPEWLADEGQPEAERKRTRHVAIQQAWLSQIRGSVRPFVSEFGGLPGEEFQATVNQALFMGNGPTVDGWLSDSPESLLGRLASIESASTLTEKLTLAVLSRMPTREETRQIEAHLGQPVADDSGARSEFIAEAAWALLSSAEFRFNH